MRGRHFFLLVALFALKLTVAVQLDRHPLLQPDTGLDTTAYVELAKRVASGDIALGPGLYYVSPLYIYFLAVVYAATKSFTAARIVQSLLGTVAVALIFLTAREWFGRRAAWIAAVLAGLTGLFTYYEALLLQSSLDTFLTALALWLLTLALEREKQWLPLIAGCAFGVATLNRPNMLVPAIAIAIVLLTARRWRVGALMFAGIVIGLAPVTVRNLVVAHEFALVTSHSGINFYIGNGEGATGYFHAISGMQSTVEAMTRDARLFVERTTGRHVTDAEASSYFSQLTWDWIRAHPAAWIWLLIRKTYAVFNTAHVSTPFSYTFYAYDAGTLLRFLFVGPWLLVPLGLFGLIRGRARTTSYVAWAAFVPAYAASVALFFITERYKLPLFVAMAIAAGAGVEALLVRRRGSDIAIVIALAIAVNWPLHLDDGRAEERMRMAEYEADRGDVDATDRWLDLARDLRPGIPEARAEYVVGRALLAAGRPADALPHLQHAIAEHVGVPLAGYDLAVALQQTGDIAGAVRVMRALKPPPNSSAVVFMQLGRKAAELNAPDAAEPFLRRAVAVAPDLPAAHQLLGIDLIALGREGEAAAEFNAVIGRQPRNADALALLAWCETRTGRTREAREHAEAALRIAPRHELARRVLQAP
jgi:4-amino-4-deoxy-L-arabinose transferase-like glycosyltransferase/Flp pilus assembly protein TadD